MRKYFLYELKKHLWTLVILTAAIALPNIITLGSAAMYWEVYPEAGGGIMERYITNPQWEWSIWGLLLLLFIVPTIVYSFKMTKRGVDGYYALPLKKEKLYFVATMVGLILVLVPFTVSYWGGFIALLVRPDNPYDMVYFLPTYLGVVFFAVFLYGINAFVFTRANRTSDGVIFMLAYAFIGMLAYEYVWYVYKSNYGHGLHFSYSVQSAFTFGCGILEFTQEMSDLITHGTGNFDCLGLWLGVAIAAGTLCYFLLFKLLCYEKGENAEQNSDSWFGYKTLIPAYVGLGLAANGAIAEAGSVIFLLIAALVGTIVHKRTFRLKGMDLLPLIVGVGAGIFLSLFAL